MAVAAMEWARRLRVGSVARKAVLLVLADRAKDGTWQVWVGQETLAVEADVSERTVRRVLSELEAWGLICREQRRRPDGYRTSDLIRLNVGASISPDTVSPDMSSPDTAAGSSDQGEQPHRTESPRTIVQTSPANDGQPHRTQCPGYNGKLEPEVEPGSHARARDTPPSLTDLATDDTGFERFVAAFPRKVKLKSARVAWRWALGHGDPETIIRVAGEYAEWVFRTGEREQFVEEPANWLSRQGWTDSYEPTRPDDPWQDWLDQHGARTATAEELGLAIDEDGVLRAAGAHSA